MFVELRESLPRETRELVWRRANNACEKCGISNENGPTGWALEVAHVIPYRKSRSHHPDGLALLCDHCHPEWDALEASGELLYGEWIALPHTRPETPPEKAPKSRRARRNRGIMVSVTEEEYDALRKASFDTGNASAADFMRSVALQCAKERVSNIQPLAQSQKAIRDLRKQLQEILKDLDRFS